MKITRQPLFWLFVVLSILVIVLTSMYRQTMTARTPPNTLTTFAMGNLDDYHQYMNYLKRGRQGLFLYHNAWSEENIPDVLLQPIYNVIGFISKPFSVSIYDIYYYFQIFSFILLFTSAYLIIKRVSTNTHTQIVAALLFFSYTGYWWITSFSPFTIQKHLLLNANFDVFAKYQIIPPHHTVAIAILMFALLLFTKTNRRMIDTLLGGLCATLLALIHPFILFMLLVILACQAFIDSITQKRVFTRAAGDLTVSVLFCLIPVGYMIYMYSVILRFSVATAGILNVLPRAESFASYMQALGPVFILATPSLFLPEIWKSPIKRYLLYWGFTPVILFFFPDFHIPMNTWRLFQVYQPIPLSILAALSIYTIFRNFRLYPVIALIIGSLFFLYGATEYAWLYQLNAQLYIRDLYNVFVPNTTLEIFSYFNTHTPEDSVILGGSVFSSMVPEFTHNRVIVGHNGNNRNYLVKLHDVGMFLSNDIPLTDVRSFLKKYNVSYIVFGIDSLEFAKTPYVNLPYLREVFKTEDSISIVAVLPDK